MLTNYKITQLHGLKEYRKSNGICKNLYLSLPVVDAGEIISAISLTYSSSTGTTLKLVGLKAIWFILRYFVITANITSCRSRIIEALLNREYQYNEKSLIKDIVCDRKIWIEYSIEKLKFLEASCIDYLAIAENRIVLIQVSENSAEQCNKDIRLVEDKIRILFENAREDVSLIEIRTKIQNYFILVTEEESKTYLKELFQETSSKGKLTGDVTRIGKGE